ncbi:MAG: XRE family transcriptional regulator [Chitinophagaceae bacterium]|nr:MAG: XRE family transcriptional regulator [Chitinophagaceae bacterium]
MKMLKKIIVLRGPAALRVRMGVTQEVFAQYLGIATSTVSMIESGQRPVPMKALIKLTEIEMAFARQGSLAAMAPALLTPASGGWEQEKEKRRHNSRVMSVGQVKYRLQKMVACYEELMKNFSWVQLGMELHGQMEGSMAQAAMVRANFALKAKLRRCDPAQQAKLRARLAMLEIRIAEREARELTQNITANNPAPDKSMAVLQPLLKGELSAFECLQQMEAARLRSGMDV